MIETFTAENFRGFKYLNLTGLKNVNIMVGRSAAGKTALMEGIRLALGATPQVAWNLNAQRGLPILITANPTREQFESPWSNLFYKFDLKSEIKLNTTDSLGRTAQCKIFFDPNNVISPEVSPQFGALILPGPINPIAFDRIGFDGIHSVLYCTLSRENIGQLRLLGGVPVDQPPLWQMHMQAGPELGIVCELIHSNTQYSTPKTAQIFSRLNIQGKTDDIQDVLKREFREIETLHTESPSGVPAIFAKLKKENTKVPISLVSSGITKFVSILLTIKEYAGGVVLIDEIENGIWFKTLPTLWRAIHQVAVDNDTQIFLSTHSLECLESSLPTIEKHKRDFSLIQVTQSDENGVARVVSGSDAAAAIESEIELRR